MTLTLRLLQSQYSICENGKYVIMDDKLEVEGEREEGSVILSGVNIIV